MLGVYSRYWVGTLFQDRFATPFPLATFFINLLGSFLIGFVYVLSFEKNWLEETVRVGIIVGFLGGFTTFSAFSLEVVTLIESNRPSTAFLYLSLSSVLGILACAAGFVLARNIAFK